MIRYEQLPVANLELDVSNPRVARIIEMYGAAITYDRMRLALGVSPSDDPDTGTTFYSLRESIKTNGGIIHPIIVNDTADGRLVVIEGNTRTVIYKEFVSEGLEGDWDTIPAIVHPNLSQADIDAVRLQAHLVGPRQWDPYSKAKYLHHLRNAEHLSFNQIVDFCGGRQQEIIRYIDAYTDMEEFYRPVLESDDQFDATRFSAFVEMQRGTVLDALLQGGFTKSDFAQWVHDGLISPLSLVRSLPRILKNTEARDTFIRDGAREAAKLLDAPSPLESLRIASFTQILNEIKRRIWAMPYIDLRRLKEQIGSEDNDAIIETRDALVQLCEDIATDG